MYYSLILGIEYKKYKKPVNITLHINNLLIDNFQLSKDHDDMDISENLDVFEESMLRKYKLISIVNRYDKKHPRFDIRFTECGDNKIPKFYKVYKIPENIVCGDLRINVENSNTDYNNGFMRNMSLIKFPVIALIPHHLTQNKNEKLISTMAKIDDGLRKFKIRNKREQEIAFCKSGVSWPTVDNFCVDPKNKKFSTKRIQQKNFWIGDSFSLNIPIEQKHKTKYLCSNNQKKIGFPSTGYVDQYILASFKPLINTLYEDQ